MFLVGVCSGELLHIRLTGVVFALIAGVDDDDVIVCDGRVDEVRDRINPLRLRCCPLAAEDVEAVAAVDDDDDDDPVEFVGFTVLNCNWISIM